nr:EamA family transporter [Bacillus sp. FJAT-27231]
MGLSSYQKHFKRINKSDFTGGFFLRVIGVFINQWSFFVGLQTADPAISALILATPPILTSVLAAIF